eukprot:COSAG02_NODE_1543_length_12003_cov_16.681536_3_plen_148_part_00
MLALHHEHWGRPQSYLSPPADAAAAIFRPPAAPRGGGGAVRRDRRTDRGGPRDGQGRPCHRARGHLLSPMPRRSVAAARRSRRLTTLNGAPSPRNAIVSVPRPGHTVGVPRQISSRESSRGSARHPRLPGLGLSSSSTELKTAIIVD